MHSPLDPIIVPVDVTDSGILHITALSDIHIESPACDYKLLREILEERAELSNHRVIIIGDLLDSIGPKDPRYQHSVSQPQFKVDDWVDRLVDFAVERLSIPGVRYDLITPGNHEAALLKAAGTDVTSRIAKELGAHKGPYAGILDYRLILGTSRTRFRVLFHHGSWGGFIQKGYGGAMRWAHRYDDWNVFVFGHNHSPALDLDARIHRAGSGKGEVYPVYLVNCGSWVQPLKLGDIHYSVKRGHAVTTSAAPLIRVRVRKRGKGRLVLRYSVEV